MFPVLTTLHLGGRDVGLHSYGLLIAVGLAAGIWLAHRQARQYGLDTGRVLDLAFWMTVSGLVGSRIVYVIVNAGDFLRVCLDGSGSPRGVGAWLSDCTRPFQVWEGGLVFYGGVAAAALVGLRFAKREGWSFASIGDVFAPALALGHAFGRLGCAAAGCCFGKETGTDYGVAFPRGSVAFDELVAAGVLPPNARMTPHLHPTQLYEAIGEIMIFFALMVLGSRLRRRPGALLLLYLAAYAVLRFVVELFRGDVARRFVVSMNAPRLAEWLHLPPDEPILLSVGQLSSLIVLAVIVIAGYRRRRVPQTPAP